MNKEEQLTPRRMNKKMLSPYMYLIKDNQDEAIVPKKRARSEYKKNPTLPFDVHYNHETVKNTPEKKKRRLSDKMEASQVQTEKKQKKKKNAQEKAKKAQEDQYKQNISQLQEVLGEKNYDLEKDKLIFIGCIGKIKELREKYFGPRDAHFINPNEDTKNSFEKEYCALELCIQEQFQQIEQQAQMKKEQVSRKEAEMRINEKDNVINELQKAFQDTNKELELFNKELNAQREANNQKQIQINQLTDANKRMAKSIQDYKKMEEYGTTNVVVQQQIEQLKQQKGEYEKRYYDLKGKLQDLQTIKEENLGLKLELDHRVKDLKVENEKLQREYAIILKEHKFFRNKCKQLEGSAERNATLNEGEVKKRTQQFRSQEGTPMFKEDAKGQRDHSQNSQIQNLYSRQQMNAQINSRDSRFEDSRQKDLSLSRQTNYKDTDNYYKENVPKVRDSSSIPRDKLIQAPQIKDSQIQPVIQVDKILNTNQQKDIRKASQPSQNRRGDSNLRNSSAIDELRTLQLEERIEELERNKEELEYKLSRYDKSMQDNQIRKLSSSEVMNRSIKIQQKRDNSPNLSSTFDRRQQYQQEELPSILNNSQRIRSEISPPKSQNLGTEIQDQNRQSSQKSDYGQRNKNSQKTN